MDERTERDEMHSLYSDLYKDRYGVRPRGPEMLTWTAQDFRDAIEELPEFQKDRERKK
jgi:hypothetical protein